ncbi:MAG TPA: hypothetical protein VN748_04895 [Pseudonocardiaceae bacterium]|nr:hypothetical protein [Pseudonocardiaceae bacterium]
MAAHQVGAAGRSPADEVHAEMPPAVIDMFPVAARTTREEMIDRLTFFGAQIVVGPKPLWRHRGIAGSAVRNINEQLDVCFIPTWRDRESLDIEPGTVLHIEPDTAKLLRE